MGYLFDVIMIVIIFICYIPVHEFGHYLVFRHYGIKVHLELQSQSYQRLALFNGVRMMPNDENTMSGITLNELLTITAAGGLLGLCYLIVIWLIFAPMFTIFGITFVIAFICWYGIGYTIYETYDNWRINQ